MARGACRLLPSDNPLDAPVRHEPDDGDQHVERDRDPRIDECQHDAGTIEDRRYLALDVAAERFGQYGPIAAAPTRSPASGAPRRKSPSAAERKDFAPPTLSPPE